MEHELLSRMPHLSPQAIKLLMLRRTLDILETSTKKARTMKEIADALGKDIGPVWHHVRSLVKAGLLTETGSRKRAGRAQKLYRASATEYFVPSDIRSSTVSSELTKIMETSIEFGDGAIGELFRYDGARWRVENIYDEDTTGEYKQHERWLIARLDSRQREKLENEITTLFEKYSCNQASTGGRSIIRFACVSLPSEFA